MDSLSPTTSRGAFIVKVTEPSSNQEEEISPRHSSSPPLETSKLNDAAQKPSVVPAQEQPLPLGLGQPWKARQGSHQGPAAGEAD